MRGHFEYDFCDLPFGPFQGFGHSPCQSHHGSRPRGPFEYRPYHCGPHHHGFGPHRGPHGFGPHRGHGFGPHRGPFGFGSRESQCHGRGRPEGHHGPHGHTFFGVGPCGRSGHYERPGRPCGERCSCSCNVRPDCRNDCSGERTDSSGDERPACNRRGRSRRCPKNNEPSGTGNTEEETVLVQKIVVDPRCYSV